MKSADWDNLLRCREARADRALVELVAQRDAETAALEACRVAEHAFLNAERQRIASLRAHYAAAQGRALSVGSLKTLVERADQIALTSAAEWAEVQQTRSDLDQRTKDVSAARMSHAAQDRSVQRAVELRLAFNGDAARSVALIEEIEQDEVAVLGRLAILDGRS